MATKKRKGKGEGEEEEEEGEEEAKGGDSETDAMEGTPVAAVFKKPTATHLDYVPSPVEFKCTTTAPEVVVWTCDPTSTGIHVPVNADLQVVPGTPSLLLHNIRVFQPRDPVQVYTQAAVVTKWAEEPFETSYSLASTSDPGAQQTQLPAHKTIDTTHVRGVVLVGLDVNKANREVSYDPTCGGDPTSVFDMCGAFLVCRPPNKNIAKLHLASAGIMFPGMPNPAGEGPAATQAKTFLKLMTAIVRTVFGSGGEVLALGRIKPHGGSLFNANPTPHTDTTPSALPLCFLDTSSWIIPTPWYLGGPARTADGSPVVGWLACQHPRTTPLHKFSVHNVVFFETIDPASNHRRALLPHGGFSPAHVLFLCTDELYPSTEFTPVVSTASRDLHTADAEAGVSNPVHGLHRCFLMWGLNGTDATRLKIALLQLYSSRMGITTLRMQPTVMMFIMAQHANEATTIHDRKLLQVTLAPTKYYEDAPLYPRSSWDDLLSRLGQKKTAGSMEPFYEAVQCMMGTDGTFTRADSESARTCTRLLAACVVSTRACIWATNSDNVELPWAAALHSVRTWFAETCSVEIRAQYKDGDTPPQLLAGLLACSMKTLDDTVFLLHAKQIEAEAEAAAATAAAKRGRQDGTRSGRGGSGARSAGTLPDPAATTDTAPKTNVADAVLGDFALLYKCILGSVNPGVKPPTQPSVEQCLRAVKEMDGVGFAIGHGFLLDRDEMAHMYSIKRAFTAAGAETDTLTMQTLIPPAVVVMTVASMLFNACCLQRGLAMETELGHRRCLGVVAPLRVPVPSTPCATNTPDVMEALTEFATETLHVTLDSVTEYMTRAGSVSLFFRPEHDDVIHDGELAIRTIGDMVLSTFTGSAEEPIRFTVNRWLQREAPTPDKAPVNQFLCPPCIKTSTEQRNSVEMEKKRNHITTTKLTSVSTYVAKALRELEAVLDDRVGADTEKKTPANGQAGGGVLVRVEDVPIEGLEASKLALAFAFGRGQRRRQPPARFREDEEEDVEGSGEEENEEEEEGSGEEEEGSGEEEEGSGEEEEEGSGEEEGEGEEDD